MRCLAASFATASVVGPGTGSAASYQRLSWPGQKYGPLKISCRQRICTPFFPASSISGACLSNIACLILATGCDSSLIGLLHWMRPAMSLRGIEDSFCCCHGHPGGGTELACRRGAGWCGYEPAG